MDGVLSHSERDRRWSALSTAMREQSLDALVIVANDYNGHKGAVRYVANHRVFGFGCYAVIGRDREPTVIQPAGMRGTRQGGWTSDYRYARSMVDELAGVLRELPEHGRIGVVGMNAVMRVADHRRLGELLPESELVDADAAFERVRAAKSVAELRGAEEASYIADRCLDRLLEVARPGVTKRQLAAETYRVNTQLGGEDPIWLTLDNLDPSDPARTRFSPPSDDVVAVSELLMFSFELIGPSGYWVELCRMATFSEPSDEALAIHAAVRDTMEAGRDAMRPGATPTDVQRAMLAMGARHGTHPEYWLGHGIGQDVIEHPLIGFDVVQQQEATGDEPPLTDPMLFAVHPLLVPDGPGLSGYMADTYVVQDGGARPLSQHGLDLLRLPS